jgi:methionyl-tRNA formyltransferase
MKKLSLAYFGSPDFSADFLEKILLDKNLPIEIKLVVTQPDSLVGRRQILTPTPVKIVAEKYKIPVVKNLESIVQNSELNDKILNSQLNSEFIIHNSKLGNIDLALVYAFGELIPKKILSLPKYGFWNIHPSLLPRYRGPSPIASPLIAGDQTTGVTIIKMDEEIDHGPIIAQESLTIKNSDRRPDLEKKLTDLGFEMFKKILSDEDTDFSNFSFLEKSSIKSRLMKQNHKEATYTKKLTKQDGFVPFENLKLVLSKVEGLKIKNSPEVLYNLFRGLYPWPGIWTLFRQPACRQAGSFEEQALNNRLNEKRFKITDMDFINGKLIIKKVQLEGKKEVDFETFNKAYKIF